MARRYKKLNNAASKAAKAVDSFRYSPQNIATDALTSRNKKLQAVIDSDPRWLAAHTPTATNTAANTANKTVTLEELQLRSEIEESLGPDPVWVPVAEKLSNVRATTALYNLRRRVQRASRGWADADVWNLGWYLTSTTADMLDHLADHGFGWPQSEEFPTHESYTAALRENARKLRAYSDEETKETDTWWSLKNANTSKEETDKAFDAINEAAATRVSNAKEAMHWVATHLPDLWD